MKKIILTIALLTISTSAFADQERPIEEMRISQESNGEDKKNFHKEENLIAEKNEVSFSCTDQNVAQ